MALVAIANEDDDRNKRLFRIFNMDNWFGGRESPRLGAAQSFFNVAGIDRNRPVECGETNSCAGVASIKLSF